MLCSLDCSTACLIAHYGYVAFHCVTCSTYSNILSKGRRVRRTELWGSASYRTIFSAFSPTCSAMLTRFWLRKHVPWKRSQAVSVHPLVLVFDDSVLLELVDT